MSDTHPYYDLLDRWENAVKESRRWQKEEKTLRDQIFNGTFPDPKEGTNKHELPDGRIVKAVHKLYYKVDDAVLRAVRQKLIDEHDIDVEVDLIKRKPELAVGPYKKLPEDVRAILDDAITSKPGTPTIEIV